MSNIGPSANLLGLETSPYLLQHKDNPVHWLPWSEQAFARAREEGKPVLLSVGYAACHWCHVMARESFEDAETAALMNALFVNVKLDREERPDLDHIYQAALAMLGQPGGWPLTLFLTPDAVPFWGGTYFPPRPRYGRPGFGEVLVQVAEAWRRQPEAVGRAAATLREGLDRLGLAAAGEAIPPALIDRVAERLVREVDPFHGGLGEAPKFPQVPAFELLWRAWLRTGRPPYRIAVITTLTRMSQGGIYDHVGGGFARYATDAEWRVPHFEKMLYDNAQLVDLLTLVWQGTGDPLYARRVEETVDWVLGEMSVTGGGFASSLDADSEHEEGKFTVWTVAEVDSLLGEDAGWFKQSYGVTDHGNWEGVNILNRSHCPALGSVPEEARLATLRQRLREARSSRPRPGWDDKVLADWNGLMIMALARAGLAFERPDWIAAARRAFEFVVGSMTVAGRLRHSWREGRLGSVGMLDDYGAMALAALTLFEASGEPALVRQAQGWLARADRHYWDFEGGGYFLTADDAEGVLVRSKSVQDGATPNGNGLMLGVLARLYHLTGEEGYRARAEALIRTFSGEIPGNALGAATLLNQVEMLDGAVVIAIVGDPDAEDTAALRRVVGGLSLPNRVLVMQVAGAESALGHPAHGKAMVDGRATAYVCAGLRCGPPLTRPEALKAALMLPGR
jgi:uncharacterized protein YyaL (SSP411 family)